jgi:hypothetical protein
LTPLVSLPAATRHSRSAAPLLTAANIGVNGD